MLHGAGLRAARAAWAACTSCAEAHLAACNLCRAPPLQQERYLLRRETAVVLPPADELAAAVEEVSADPANSTAWLGCVVAPSAVLAGDVTEVLDGVQTAEACCRACRDAGVARCTVFNWCNRPEGCR